MLLLNKFKTKFENYFKNRIKEKLGFQKTSIKKKISNQIKSENGELLSKFEATLLGKKKKCFFLLEASSFS